MAYETEQTRRAPLHKLKSSCSKQLLGLIYLSMSGAALSGCATTPSGVTQSAMSSKTQTERLEIQAPIGSPLVVVRYPAFVEDAAEEKFYTAFRKQTIGGAINDTDLPVSSSNALADSIILKSNYFALSIYKELAARLPDHSVLLSPHSIALDGAGDLTSTPMTQAESLPNVLTVDFASYTFPDPSKMLGKEPLTFGNMITPLVVVRAAPQAAPATQGVLLASQPLIAGAAGSSRESLETSLDILRRGRFEDSQPELDLVSFLKGSRIINVSSHGLSSRSDNSVASVPVERIELDAKTISKFNQVKDASVDPLKTAYSKVFANRVIGLLNDVDVEKSVMAGRASAIAEFDENLAALTYIGSDDPTYKARFRYAERMLEAEQKYLSVQSLRLFDGVHNSEMGHQIRNMIKAEYDVILEREEVLKRQRASTALAVLGGIAAIGLASSSGRTCSRTLSDSEYYACVNDSQRQAAIRSIGTQALLKGTIYAASNAMSLNKLSKSLTTSYLDAVIPALEQQTSIQVSLIDSNETITAIRHEDLQVKLNELYNENTRALQDIGTRCAYGANGGPITGVWLGMCQGGLANGSGIGVLSNSSRENIEYYGYARNGLANGPGLMVVHNSKQSEALEGSFSAGLPNGIMRQSISGKADRLKVYQMGKPQGNAPAGSYVPSPFAPQESMPEYFQPSSTQNTARPIAPVVQSTTQHMPMAPVISPMQVAPTQPGYEPPSYAQSSSGLPLAPVVSDVSY